MEGERMYTVSEVADRLRLHPATIREWLRAGRLGGIRLGGTKAGWRIPASAVDEYLERHTARASASAEEDGE
jgi:excisionase family DNA binding protein